MLRKEKNTPIAFKAQSSAGALTLQIFDVIGADYYGDGITAQMVSAAIANNPGATSINIDINSPGGDLFEGVAIYNVLTGSGKPVTVNVIGLAASAASLVAMSGDAITLQLGTQMMVHEAMAFAGGFADDMRKMATTLDSVTASAADIYVAKTGLDKDDVLALMKVETWMSPDEALKQGFATALGTGNAIKNAFDLSMFRNCPVALKAEAEIEETPVEAAVFDATSILARQLEINRRK